jgi:hypothetical protein
VRHKGCSEEAWPKFAVKGNFSCPKGMYLKGFKHGLCDNINCIQGGETARDLPHSSFGLCLTLGSRSQPCAATSRTI